MSTPKVRQWVLDNTDIVLVDTGHSYSGMCEYYHGKYITYSESKPISMNPFRITEEEYNVEKKNFLKSLIFLIWKECKWRSQKARRRNNGYYHRKILFILLSPFQRLFEM
ncbi:MAG: hypothetical protein ACLR3R_15100 [Clostridium paraputrificum]